MDITFLGQAGLFIETQRGSILCDPWFNPAFFASWFPFPDNGEIDKAKIGQSTYLYISHLHYDHFDPEFLREHVWKETTVLLPDYPLDILERALRDVGFTKFIQTKSCQVVEVDGLRFMIMAMTAPNDGVIGDCGLMVDDGETRIFNQNDAQPVDIDILTSFSPFDAHFLQFSGATWYPMVYQFPEKMMQALGRKKRENSMARALRYAQEIGASFIFPSSGPPCFLDDDLFHFNDFDRDPANAFPDQVVFLEYMQAHGMSTGRLIIPGSVVTLSKRACSIEHPLPEEQIQAIFTKKRAYLEAYQARKQPLIHAIKATWIPGQVDILASLRDWFEPLLEQSNLICAGVNGRVLFDLGTQTLVIDFQQRRVYTWNGEEWDYRFQVDPALVEACIIRHEEDWLNYLFLSFRFQAQRKGAFNEYLYNFLRCLSPERIQYAESYYAKQPSIDQLWESDGYRIQRRCPHMKADLKRFGKIEDGILTCGLHGWQYELATGRCLTSEGYRLYAQPIAKDRTVADGSGGSKDSAGSNGEHKFIDDPGQLVRKQCKDCWYNPSRWSQSSKMKREVDKPGLILSAGVSEEQGNVEEI